MGEKSGLVVRAEGSRPRGLGFESRRMLALTCSMNNEIKIAKWGTPKNKKIMKAFHGVSKDFCINKARQLPRNVSVYTILEKLYLFTDHEKLRSLGKEYHGDSLYDCGHGAQAEHVPTVDN
jgi:hypothetical protein